jgi:hypothetical protein
VCGRESFLALCRERPLQCAACRVDRVEIRVVAREVHDTGLHRRRRYDATLRRELPSLGAASGIDRVQIAVGAADEHYPAGDGGDECTRVRRLELPADAVELGNARCVIDARMLTLPLNIVASLAPETA